MTELSSSELPLPKIIQALCDMSPVYPDHDDMIFSPLQIYRLAFWPLKQWSPVCMLNVQQPISWQGLNAAIAIFWQCTVRLGFLDKCADTGCLFQVTMYTEVKQKEKIITIIRGQLLATNHIFTPTRNYYREAHNTSTFISSRHSTSQKGSFFQN